MVEPLIVSQFSKDADRPTAATYLGVGETTIKKLVSSGEIPSFMLGSRRMIAVADLKAFVEARRAQLSDLSPSVSPPTHAFPRASGSLRRAFLSRPSGSTA
jgi:excisionase family DNA binding protein